MRVLGALVRHRTRQRLHTTDILFGQRAFGAIVRRCTRQTISSWSGDKRGAVADADGDGADLEGGGGDEELDGGCGGVDVGCLVEDEVAYAVVDVMPVVVLDGLEGVGMMANEYVGSGIDEGVGLHSLQRRGSEGVFCTPVEGDDDDGFRASKPEVGDSLQQAVHSGKIPFAHGLFLRFPYALFCS